MPVLKDARQEKFAQALAKGMTQVAAAVAAGYAANDATAARRANSPSVRARVAELQGRAAEKAVLTKTAIIERLFRLADKAEAAGQISAANRAVELLGKEIGMFVDRRLLGIRRIEDMTEEELLEFLGGEPDDAELRTAAGTPAIGHA